MPKRLQAAIGGTVLVAGQASARTADGAGCEDRLRWAESPRFANGTIDEFSLTATFRAIVAVAGEAPGPTVVDCVARWSERRQKWWATMRCGHYAPAWTLKAVIDAGSGLSNCDAFQGRKLLMLWLVPPRGARWLVVRRNHYAIAYPVAKRAPIRVTYVDRPALNLQAQARFRYEVVNASGHVTRASVLGAVAG